MATYAPSIGRTSSAGWRRFAVSPWAWCIAAVLVIAARDLAQGLDSIVHALGDSDDALRLHEVRELLAGKARTDMSLPRLGGVTPLISHWSRLIDLPLALLIKGFGLVMAPDKAELVTRIVWPLIVLMLFLLVMVRAAIRQGARTAPLLMLTLALTCSSGLYQFHIGRIDHHNVMILGAVGGLLLLLGARRDPHEGLYAGALIGLGLAVGYEPLAILVPCIAGAALLAIADLRWLEGVRNMMLALAGVLALVFVLTVAPTAWLVPRCDALSLNMVLLMAAGAAGVVMADRFGRDRTFAIRLGMLAAAGAVGVALYGAQDTRCLAGPFGQIDPRLGPVWLNTVVEGFNAWRVLQIAPLPIVAYAATVIFGIWAAVERWRRLRSPEAVVVLALVLISAPFGFWMIKLAPYASWIAVFSIALALADITDGKQISAPTLQFSGVMVASQWTATLIAVQLMTAFGATPEQVQGKPTYDESACLTTAAIRSLNALPKGFIAGNVDLGPFVVALTDHDVLAGPYHRIDKAILANQSILDAEPGKAQALLQQQHADYLVLCLPKPGDQMPGVAPNSVSSVLINGGSIGYLEPLKLDSPSAQLKAWRVMR